MKEKNTYIIRCLFCSIVQASTPEAAWVKFNTEEQSLNNMLDTKETRERLLDEKYLFIEPTRIPEVYLCKR